MNIKVWVLNVIKYVGQSGWIGLWYQGWYESPKFNGMHMLAIECQWLRFDGVPTLGPEHEIQSSAHSLLLFPQDVKLKALLDSELKFREG